MTAPHPETPARHRRPATVAAVSLLLVAVVAVTAGVLQDRVSGPVPPQAVPVPAAVGSPEPARHTPSASSADPGTPPAPSSAPAPAGPAVAKPLPASPPVSVRVPRVGIRTSLVRLGRAGDGALETPRDPGEAGWYTGSPEPGALGPAIIAGHVTWNGAEAAFFRLGDVRSGDQIDVERKDGSTATFAVTRVEEYPKDRFPTVDVYSDTAGPELRLITCAGEYQADRHYYPHNLVVYARLAA